MAPELKKIIDITRQHDAKLAEEELLEESRRVPQLDPPRAGQWPLLLLRPGREGHVWVRLITPACDAAFRQLMSGLEEWYGQRALGLPVAVDALRPGQVVAAPVRGFWCRARLLRVGRGRAALASIDEATTACLPLAQLRLLEPRFAQLPQQAFRCRLQEAGGGGVPRWLLQRLSARRLPALFLAGGWPAPPTARLQLPAAHAAHQLSRCRPRLPPEGATVLARVSHVSRGGAVFVRMRGDCVPALEAALRRAVAMATAEQVARASPLRLLADPSRVLLAPAAGGLWCRAAVHKYAPYSAQVVVRLIDHGMKKVFPVNDLIILDRVDELINNLPPQALRVHLAGVRTPLSEAEASLLRRVTSRRTVALQAVGTAGGRRGRRVRLFARRGPTQTSLCSLALLVRGQRDRAGEPL
uniref:Tudor domain-containing protein Tdr19 n=1 Tax=Locusta migratoria TaxID=7004 RepID=A0AAU7J8Y3_LOCMI